MSKFPKLFIPGPTHVSDDILKVLSTPQIGHRTPEISDLILELKSGLKEVLYTDNKIYLISHAATGLWEMGLTNSVQKGVLHAVNGAFSSKWSTVPDKCGLKSKSIDYDWGLGVQAEDVDEMLKTGDFDVFAMVHNETSTGVKSNLDEISQLLKSKYPDVIWLVDAVSSMAGIKIEIDRLGIDFIFSSTQKAWGIPAGFSILSASNRFIEKSKNIENKGYFLDILTYEKYYEKDQTPSTPSIPHMFALKKVLQIIQDEGLDERWARHREMSSITQDWALSHNQTLFPEPGCRSETITCINNIQNWDINKINDKLLSLGYRMDRGYGKLRGDAFRIAHMGNIYKSDLLEYLEDFDKVLSNV
tara:strand:- start:3560 stop:4639 length:1080 start_codon:yes stop_codon:yes gene_type:complete